MLPPEIFSEIFSFLASEARILVACSQAHPIFAQLVEPTLYAHVIVHHDDDAGPGDGHHLRFKPYQLSMLLSDSPRILNYLRSLCVEFSRSYKANNRVVKEMITILPELKLERIQLTLTDVNNCVNWLNLFPTAFHMAFVGCISTSLMKEIRLCQICDIPLSTFANCTGLKRLTLFEHTVPPLNRTFDFPHLDVLELLDWEMDYHSYRKFVPWALTHACGLCSLTLRTLMKTVISKFLPHLLAICSASLTNLSIYYVDPFRPMFDTIEVNFPGLPNLERLLLCTFTGPLNLSDNNLIRHALITIAQILRSCSSVKHLILILCLPFWGADITKVDWSPLANLLSDWHSSESQHTDLHIRATKAGDKVPSDEIIYTLSHYDNLMSLVEAGYVSIGEEMYLDEHVDRLFNYKIS